MPIHSVLTLPPSVNSAPVCCRFANRTIQMVSSLLPHGHPPLLPLKDEGAVPVTSVPSCIATLYGGPKHWLAHLRDSLCSFNRRSNVWKEEAFKTAEGTFLSHKSQCPLSYSVFFQSETCLSTDVSSVKATRRTFTTTTRLCINGDQRIILIKNSWKPPLPPQ